MAQTTVTPLPTVSSAIQLVAEGVEWGQYSITSQKPSMKRLGNDEAPTILDCSRA